MRFAAIVAIGLVTCIASAQPAGDAAAKELKLFQGKWMAVFAQGIDGQPLPDEALRTTSLTVEGDKFTLKTADSTVEGTFKIDPTKKPKTIDVFTAESKDKPLVMGIYQIDGEVRRSCFALPDKGRPDRIRKESGYVVLEWKRAK